MEMTRMCRCLPGYGHVQGKRYVVPGVGLLHSIRALGPVFSERALFGYIGVKCDQDGQIVDAVSKRSYSEVLIRERQQVVYLEFVTT